MISKWYEHKEKAVALRGKGISIVAIEKRLGIPRSTLSGWFKNVALTQKQKSQLQKNKNIALVKARKKAALSHNLQKKERLEVAKKQAIEALKGLPQDDVNILELALAILYLGEGSKKDRETSLGSSDPLILKFFLKAIEKVYAVDRTKLRCELYLRADQSPFKIKQFWSKELNIPIEVFKQVNFDKRTVGTKTYDNYKGVCHIRCGNVAMQRRLVQLSRLFCERAVHIK